MEVQFGPNASDEPSLLYKLQRKIKVFDSKDTLPCRGYNLVASSSKYGIVFVASPDGTLSAFYLNQLIDKECDPQYLPVRLPEKPSHIAVSCNHELLAVTGGQLLCIYNIADFQNPNVQPAVSMKTDANPSTFVSSLQWNPCMPDTIAIAFYDGTLLVSQVTTGQVNKVQSKARCICWSPKGKQLVTGNSDGTLCQYKPNLAPAKMIPAPNLFEGAPVEALAVYWISTFQFAVVYKNAADNSRPAVTIVNTPKAGQPSCLNYEDICYSTGSSRPWYYYLQGLPQWNIILSSSSNSMEIATLGSADCANWLQWCQTDEARPELPLTDKKIENYPVGICIDTSAIHQLPWGENEVLPHMPLLLVVSQTGLLTLFNVIYLNKQAPPLCSPPTPLALPAQAMPTLTPVAPAPVPAPAVALPKPQPVQPQPIQPPQPSQPPQPVAPQPTPQPITVPSVPNSAFGALPTSSAAKIFQQIPQGLTIGHAPQAVEQKPTEVKPATAPPVQPQVQTQPKPTPVPAKPQPTPAQEAANAALKAEQERANKMKANQELKNMLIKEVNDFQMELYKFMVKTRETQVKLQRDLDAINTNFNLQSMDAEQLKKDCSLEDLRNNIVQLKLELVKACAVVAEARTHAEAKDVNQWSQVDPLTSKRVSSVKKLAYYVQNQVEQAQKALDYKWNIIATNEMNMHKPGQRMIRPILDDVYQPLVKQQEILGRQQAVLRTLRNTLKELETTPMFKSASLLRSTPFKNKDPLSKLTKNILNMSIEPQSKPKEPLLNAQKLDALRDMLSNHKTIKIKPVNVEMRQRLATMKINYEKSLREKAAAEQVVEEQKVVPKVEPPAPVTFAPKFETVKFEPKQEIKQSPISIPSFSAINNLKPVQPPLSNVARTLFTDEPKYQPVKPQLQQPVPISQVQPQPILKPKQSTFTFAAPTSSISNTRSVLKELLQNKQALANAKNEANVTEQKYETPNIQKPEATSLFGQKNEATSLFGQKSAASVLFGQKSEGSSLFRQNNEASSIFGQKNDANTFMGQKICSPTAFAASTPASVPPSSNLFTAKPISDITNMLNKFQPQSFVSESKPQAFAAESKPQAFAPESKTLAFTSESKIQALSESKAQAVSESKAQTVSESKAQAVSETKAQTVSESKAQEQVKPKSSETGEPEVLPKVESKKEDKPMTNLFGMKSTPLSAQNVPDIVKTDKPPKENVPENSFENTSQSTPVSSESTEDKSDVKPLSSQSTNKSSLLGPPPVSASAIPDASESQKPEEAKTESKPEVSKPAASSASASLFAAANASTPTELKSPPEFTSAATPTTETPTVAISTPTTTPETTKTSIFGTPPSSASSLFGSAVASSFSPKTTQTGSIFNSTSTTNSSVLGSSPSSVFGTAATTASVFSSSESKPSVFSTPTPASAFGTTTTQSSSVFAASPAFAATNSSVFSSTPAFDTTTTSSSIFGSTSPSSVFGTATTTTQSLFGSTPETTAQSVFSGAATSQSLFGGTSTTTQSLFGSTPATTASSFGTTPSVFGAATTTQSLFGTTPQNVFGTATSTTQASVFGSPATTQSVFSGTTPSVFGTPSTQASVFGGSGQSVFGSAQTTQASVFGSPTQTTQASVFGGTAVTTAQSGSLFGGGEANLFAAASISTTSAPSQTSGGNIFGGGSTGSVFGGGTATNVFGGKPAFGQSNASAASIFGGGASFGQKPANNFWSGGNTSGGGFGSGFGQQATTQASSIFGGTTGGSFSTPNAGQPFGSPQQNTGFGENKPSVFGTPQQQSASAFGGSPVFASKPAFGQTAAFSSPTGGGFGSFGGFNKSPTTGFGAPAAFGASAFGGSSPNRPAFGGSPPSFGAPTQSNATFENLATQNTLTFGNLAQQSGSPPQQQQPTFNTSPSFTGWRG